MILWVSGFLSGGVVEYVKTVLCSLAGRFTLFLAVCNVVLF